MKFDVVKFKNAVRIGGYEEINATDGKHNIELDYEHRTLTISRKNSQRTEESCVPFENVLYFISADESKETASQPPGSIPPKGTEEESGDRSGDKKVAISEAARIFRRSIKA